MTKRFRLNGNTAGFGPQTQKVLTIIHYGNERVSKVNNL